MSPYEAALNAIIDTSQMLDASYPDHLCSEAVDRRRFDKIGEELGEVVEAYGGMVGENPRKGTTHGLADVLDELLDVAAVALGAYEHLDGHRGRSLPALAGLIVRKRDRLAAAIGAANRATADLNRPVRRDRRGEPGDR